MVIQGPEKRIIVSFQLFNKLLNQIQEIETDVDLLIGTNAPYLMEPLEIINSRANGP